MDYKTQCAIYRKEFGPAPRRPGSTLARARISFLLDEHIDPSTVRAPILASWTRARNSSVPADHIDLPFNPGSDRDSLLTRTATPIVREVAEQFAGQPVSVILCDDDGVVLDQHTGDSRLQKHLDAVKLAPGFSYAERHVGTNGIGSALTSRGPAQVFGHEHYVERLDALACVGYPIRHPVNRRLLGVIDLTCWRHDGNHMMVAAVSTIARRIEETLLGQSGRRELSLLHDYVAAAHRNRSAVFGLGDDLLMMNGQARNLLDPGDQLALLAEAAEALKSGRHRRVLIDLPSGATARADCLPSWPDTGAGGGILQVKLVEGATRSRVKAIATAPAMPPAVGSGALWVKCCHAVDRGFHAGEWLVLDGEPGTGKTTLARAAHRRRTPTARLHTLDAADDNSAGQVTDVLERLESGGGTLVLLHIDQLDDNAVQAVADALEPHRESTDPGRLRVIVTVNHDRVGTSERLAPLLAAFPITVQVPPLRHHIEDIVELVPNLLARLAGGSTLTFSPASMRLLMRSRWPGNVEQLYRVLRKIVAKRRTGLVTLQDLPSECRSITRRLLTPVESIECDAIIEALLDNAGNKSEAARHLGMSRATIYRKIRDYGILVPSPGEDLIAESAPPQ